MNILYITVDALRSDHVCESIMPRTTELFSQSIHFTNCIANGPGTPWSFPAILSSRYSGATEGFGIPSAENDPHPTLAEVLGEQGYSTAGFTDNRFASSAYHYNRGIDYMSDTGATSDVKTTKQFFRKNLNQEGVLFQTLLKFYHIIDDIFVGFSDKGSRFVRSEVLINSLLEWTLDETEWFAWLHPMDVHAPYEAPGEYQRQYLDESVDRVKCQNLSRKAVHHPDELTDEDWELQRQLYKAECSYLDDQIDTLLSTLERRGELSETLVIFTADHGDMHGEHGRGGHPQEFWEEIVHVPLAISSPELTGKNINEQIGLIDLPPTILGEIDINPPEEWDGVQFELSSEVQNAREEVFIDVGEKLNRNHAAVRRSDGMKLMRHRGDGELLFNITESPTEEDPLSHSHDAYYELSDSLDKHLDEMAKRRSGELTGVEDEEMIEEHLKELGYLE